MTIEEIFEHINSLEDSEILRLIGERKVAAKKKSPAAAKSKTPAVPKLKISADQYEQILVQARQILLDRGVPQEQIDKYLENI